MKLLNQLAEKTLIGALLLVLKELRKLTTAVETLTDSFREVHGKRPMFHGTHDTSDSGTDVDADANRTIPHAPEPETDYLRRDILEALCRQHHIPYDSSVDLITLGKAMGWLDSSGAVIVLPTGYAD
jgi:hypothetical protein